MRILVIGAGAVGGYFGGRLAQAGRDVTFLVRARLAKKLRDGGLRIISPHGDVTIEPKLITADEIADKNAGSYDLLLLCVKAYSLEAAMSDFAAAVGPGTMILPFLNGMRHVDLLAARFGEDAVLGGSCRIVADLDQDDRIVQLTRVQELLYGERRGGISPRMQVLEETMRGAGFDATLSDNILQEMWEKWVMLASLGATTCLMRGSVGEIEAIPGGTELVLQILSESSEIAAASGYIPRETFLHRARTNLTTPGSPLTASMYRDLSKGARVEVDQILGDLLDRGCKVGVVAPLLEAACVQLRVYQAGLAAKQ